MECSFAKVWKVARRSGFLSLAGSPLNVESLKCLPWGQGGQGGNISDFPGPWGFPLGSGREHKYFPWGQVGEGT